MKVFHNRGERADFCFFRDEHGNEVDLLIPKDRTWYVIEIKSSATFHPDFLKGLRYFQKMIPDTASEITISGDEVP